MTIGSDDTTSSVADATDNTTGADASELKRIVAQREKVKQERDALSRKNEELAAKLEELEQAREVAEGDKAKIAERAERKAEQLAKELKGYKEKEQAAEQANRLTAFATAIGTKAGVQNTTRIKGLILAAGLSYDEVSDDVVSDSIEALRKLDAETFAPRSGGSTPARGLSSTTLSDLPKAERLLAVQAMARDFRRG